MEPSLGLLLSLLPLPLELWPTPGVLRRLGLTLDLLRRLSLTRRLPREMLLLPLELSLGPRLKLSLEQRLPMGQEL